MIDGAVLRALRLLAGVSLEELAQQLQVHVSVAQGVESRHRVGQRAMRRHTQAIREVAYERCRAVDHMVVEHDLLGVQAERAAQARRHQ
jgi:transcriptional regulator with XRE-family HTH domain